MPLPAFVWVPAWSPATEGIVLGNIQPAGRNGQSFPATKAVNGRAAGRQALPLTAAEAGEMVSNDRQASCSRTYVRYSPTRFSEEPSFDRKAPPNDRSGVHRSAPRLREQP